MIRGLALVAACLLCLSAGSARADTIARHVEQLNDASASYKIHLAAVLALSKSKDPRAVIALADALGHDDNATIRRIAALSLQRNVDARTADDAKALAFEALGRATSDGDAGVRNTAVSALKALGGLRLKTTTRTEPIVRGDKPEVLVHVDAATDQSQHAPADAAERLTKVVKERIEKIGYATSWPGGSPKSADLASAGSRAFIVASTVKKIEMTRVGHQVQVACTVAIRVAPWTGSDGGEKWEASKAAQAQGSAKATTGPSDREIKGGVRDCLEAVAEDITTRQIVPFLKRLVIASAP
jgi:hypothetical protein